MSPSLKPSLMKPVRDPCAYISYYFGAYFQFEGQIGEILQFLLVNCLKLLSLSGTNNHTKLKIFL